MREPIRVLAAPALPGVTVIDAHWADGLPPNCMFEAYLIRVQHSGTADLRYRRRRHRAGPGVYTVAPGEMLVHDAALALPLASRSVAIEPARFAELLAQAGVAGPAGFRTFRVTDPGEAIAAAVADLVAAVETGSPAQEPALRALVERVAAWCGEPSPEPVRHPVFARLHEHLVRHQARNVPLAELAELGRLGLHQVVRLFRNEVGLPPHAYLVQLRVARARRLISRGMAPAEVAAAVGFADQSHLGRHFRTIAARTPAGYVERRRAPTAALSVPRPARHRGVAVDPRAGRGRSGERGPGPVPDDDRAGPP